jgi:hypothetical protein
MGVWWKRLLEGLGIRFGTVSGRYFWWSGTRRYVLFGSG